MEDVTETQAHHSGHQPRNGRGHFVRDLDLIERDSRAAALVTQGWTYEQVADHLGYSDKSACWRAVRKVRHEAAQLDGGSEDLRRAQLAGLAEQRRRLWDLINNPPLAISRNGKLVTGPDGKPLYDAAALINAHAVLLRLTQREAAIRGTDAPRRSVSLTGQVGVSEIIAVFEAANPQDLSAAIKEIERRIHARTDNEQLHNQAIAGELED